MRFICLTGKYSDRIVRVDDEDFEKFMRHKWRGVKYRDGRVYAVTTAYLPNGKCGGRVKMERIIMGIKDHGGKIMVDHEDHDTLNNQKKNLRVCSSSQNRYNSRKVKKGTSKYKGVNWDKSKNQWRVRIQSKFIGLFSDEKQAARAYDQAAREAYGEFAFTNFGRKRKPPFLLGLTPAPESSKEEK